MPRAEQGTKELLQFMQGRVAGFKVTLNTFPQIYPGLIHFVHINRATNQITAPKLSAFKNGSLMSVLWKFVAKCRQVLIRKVSYIVWKDQLYTFTYSLSFENRQFFDRLAGDRVSEQILPHFLCSAHIYSIERKSLIRLVRFLRQFANLNFMICMKKT